MTDDDTKVLVKAINGLTMGLFTLASHIGRDCNFRVERAYVLTAGHPPGLIESVDKPSNVDALAVAAQNLVDSIDQHFSEHPGEPVPINPNSATMKQLRAALAEAGEH